MKLVNNPFNRYSWVLLVISIFMSCSQQKSQDYPEDNLTVISSGDEQQPISPVDIDSIKLNAGPNDPMGMISKFVAYKDCCYILDYVNKSVMKFDNAGRLVGTIDNIGNGPGEYTMLTDIDIDKNGKLYLLDVRKNTIMAFDSDSLKYLSEVKLPVGAKAFCAVDSTTFYLHKVSEDGDISIDLALYKRGENKIKPIFRYTDDQECYAYGFNNTNIWRSGDDILFYKRFSKDIYLLEDSVTKFATLDTDNLPTKEQIAEYVKAGVSGSEELLQKSNVVSNIGFIYKNKKGLLCHLATMPPTFVYTDITTDISFRLQSDKRLFGVNMGAIGVWNDKFVTVKISDGDNDPTLVLYTCGNPQ